MNKEQLMQYLTAVRNGEAAALTCFEIQQALKNRQNALEIDLQNAIEEAEEETEENKKRCNKFLRRLSAIGMAITLFKAFINPSAEGTLEVIFFILLFRLISKIVVHFIYKFKLARRIKIEEGRINRIHKEFQSLINKNESIAQNIRAELQKLYDWGIIHTRFRNIVAVNQIYEYLDTCVCDTLEGTNGAYARYYEDIRAARIVDSVFDMRDAMSRGLHKIASYQSTVTEIINKVDADLLIMNTEINEGMQKLEDSKYRFAYKETDVRKQRKEIHKVLSKAVQTGYAFVVACVKGMKVYFELDSGE